MLHSDAMVWKHVVQIESIDPSRFLLWGNAINVFRIERSLRDVFGMEEMFSAKTRCQTRVKVARRLSRIEHFGQICLCRQRRPFIPLFAPIGNFASPLICSAGVRGSG